MFGYNLVGTHKDTTFTQKDECFRVGFHLEDVGRGVFEFTICSYFPSDERNEFVTFIDMNHIEKIRTLFDNVIKWKKGEQAT